VQRFNYSNSTIFLAELHLVGIARNFTHLFDEFLYTLLLNSSKGGAYETLQLVPLQTALKREANPKPNNTDITNLPVSV
jgi:hypothetical protein